MANNFTADFEEIWAREQQTVFHKKNVAKMIVDMSFNATMGRGDTLNRPYRSTTSIQTYTRGTDITIDDLTDTQESLVVDREFATGFYIDDFDKIQSKYDLAAKYGKDNGIRLSNQVDADVLGEYTNAANDVDDGDIGGTAGNAIALTTTNVLSVFGSAKTKILKENVDDSQLFAVVSPEVENILIQQGAGKDTQLGDRATLNGFFGNYYGFKLYRSNQLSGSAQLALATQPTAADTVTIEGVTFTFVAAIGTTPGNVLIGADVDATRVNLETLINDPTTTTANGVALSLANQRLFENATATDTPAADTLDVVFKGVGVLNVLSSLAAGAPDGWTATEQVQHNFFGATGAPTLVMQKDPMVVMKQAPKRLGVYALNGTLYGVKTFDDNSKMLVDVRIKSDSFS